MPVITITGSRQSGKTTLARNLFPEYSYFNFELPSTRDLFNADPIGFLKSETRGFIFDEFQHLPDLLSYIQVLSDENEIPGRFILTGSQNFVMLEKISQSLAGRTSLFTLHPFSFYELDGTKHSEKNPYNYIQKGFYPRIYQGNPDPFSWLTDFINLYIERDVRTILNVKDLSAFSLFLRLCAGRTGQLLNLSSIGDVVGRDIKTLKTWLSVLETSYIIYLQKPYFKNFNKRITKAPKLYFYDTGLACTLLGIKSVSELETHYLRGHLFENFVISELIKFCTNNGIRTDLHFWNDKSFAEIDCVFERKNKLHAIEIKASSTMNRNFIKGLEKFKTLTRDEFGKGYVVYNGESMPGIMGNDIINWHEISRILLD